MTNAEESKINIVVNKGPKAGWLELENVVVCNLGVLFLARNSFLEDNDGRGWQGT